MKTVFFKSTVPFALVAMMGISGAFLTTSMQSADSSLAPKQGYIDSDDKPCDTPVNCVDNNTGSLCQADGQQAFGKDNNCQEVLYRPNP